MNQIKKKLEHFFWGGAFDRQIRRLGIFEEVNFGGVGTFELICA